jgi:hypothetical protein
MDSVMKTRRIVTVEDTTPRGESVRQWRGHSASGKACAFRRLVTNCFSWWATEDLYHHYASTRTA